MGTIKKLVRNIGQHLSSLSFRTGVIVLAMCILFYVISFVQMALPISVSLKGTLWFIFFGLAKTTQYAGLTILGTKGVKRIKQYFRKQTNKND